MAEIAAGAVAAEQVISTAVEAGAAYAVAKPSMPLKASFTQVFPLQIDGSQATGAAAQPRSNHTLIVIDDRAYLFGGRSTLAGAPSTTSGAHFTPPDDQSTPSGELVHDHVRSFVCIPGGPEGPQPRMNHSACKFKGSMIIYGGVDASGKVLKDRTIWMYDRSKGTWTTLEQDPTAAAPVERSEAGLFAHGDSLILYGGKNSESSPLSDVWLFNTETVKWHQLPQAPVPTTNAALVDGVLYIISSNDNLSGSLHYMNTAPDADEPPSWETITFATNPLVSGPGRRKGGGLVGVSTGYGRKYLLYFLGDRESSKNTEETSQPEQWSDLWTFQLPSSSGTVKQDSVISEAIKPANIKDTIRSKLGAETGTYTWAEVEVKLPGDLPNDQGKIHPGPRSCFGYDILPDGSGVVLWGGINAKGEIEDDAWVIRLE